MECLLREVIEKGKNYEESVGTPCLHQNMLIWDGRSNIAFAGYTSYLRKYYAKLRI